MDVTAPVSVEEHLSAILDRVRRVPPEPLPLLDALGMPIAHDVISPLAVPPFANSAMDGYAVCSTDLAAATQSQPIRLPVKGEIQAGSSQEHRVEPGTVLRIMTGAPLPPGADAVVPFEVVTEVDAEACFEAPADPGAHVRASGSDVQEGDLLVRAGTVLGPREVGLLANVGLAEVSASPRLHVVVMATGEELTEPGNPLAAGGIYDSNSILIAAAVRATGAIAHRVRCASDDPETFLQLLEDQLERADAVITMGGVSKGTRDVVKEALHDHPVHRVDFGPVAMQPGKPQGFGFLGEQATPIFTLPGNPVSSYVSFHVFVEPALRAMVGHPRTRRSRIRAILQQHVRSSPGRAQFLRGHFESTAEGPRVTTVGGHGSHLMGSLAQSNALIVIDEDVTEVEAGQPVPVMLLDREF